MPDYKIDLVHVKQLGGTRFMGYAIQSHAAMIKEGTASDRHLNLHWENEGMFAVLREEGEWKSPDGPIIVGMITFTDQQWSRCLQIGLGFVTRRFRLDGVYTAMWNRLVELAQDRGVGTISGITYASNEAMRSVAQKHGRREKGIVLEFEVPTKAQQPIG